jgi:hypothetical protein
VRCPPSSDDAYDGTRIKGGGDMDVKVGDIYVKEEVDIDTKKKRA